MTDQPIWIAITWQQAKKIVKQCPTCSLYDQTPLPIGTTPKGNQRNDLWQMDVLHFTEFGKMKYVHNTIDTYSGFQDFNGQLHDHQNRLIV